ncbi:Alpha/Beta hydrolase protein [Filobasidium floriforme]|uniref:Alpha/Beta hydrolase protein n=1 Tax=Filobasidium floriforme TaxID=5210 RepID=UPI001E8D794A|nr:Alpha/Beta hydrolase protein [Filobasidium floriforme]KAH8086572.1 Alpha/Beta hydrolase protein [Filobasidium floriforme]
MSTTPTPITRERLDLEICRTKISLSTVRRIDLDFHLHERSLPPIVFLHGFGGTKEDYLDIQFQDRFNGRSFLAYDSPGHGESTCDDPTRISMSFLVDVAEALINALLGSSASFYLVGHSMGGLVSLLLAQKCRKGRVLGFVNIKGNLAPEDCFLSRQIYQYPSDSETADGAAKDFLEAFLDRAKRSGYYGDPIYAAGFLSKVPNIHIVRPTLTSMVSTTDNATPGLLDQFLALPCPKMYMYGEQFSSLSYLPKLEQEEGVELAMIPHAGHFIMYTNPVGMWDRIYGFIQRIENGRV